MPATKTSVHSQPSTEGLNRSPDFTAGRFHQALHVTSTRAGGATVLLDRKRGIYFTLNEVGGRVWELVDAGATASEIIERLLQEYNVGRERVEADTAVTLDRLLADQLIVRGTAPVFVMHAPSPRGRALVTKEFRVPSVFRCVLMIGVAKGILKTCGLSQTIQWIERRVEAVCIRHDVSVETIKATEYKVALAGALFPGRARCLEQSLVLYYLLRQQGVPVRYCQGVQAHPFLAHAWVEFCGEPLNDVAEHVRRFARLTDQLP